MRKILFLFTFLNLTLLSLNVFADCPDACNLCGACIPQDVAAKTELSECKAEGKIATEDAIAGGKACATDQVVGTFGGMALNGPSPGQSPTGDYGVATMKKDMITMGSDAKNAWDKREHDILNAYGDLTATVSKNIPEMVDALRKANIQMTRESLKNQMDYEADMTNSGIRASESGTVSGVYPDEIKFIENELQNAKTTHTSIVIASMKAKYDSDPNFYIPLKYKGTDSATNNACPEYDPSQNSQLSDYSCYKAQKAEPGKVLEIYFKECSRLKASQMMSLRKQSSNGVVKKEVSATNQVTTNNTSSGDSLASRVNASNETSCSVEKLRENQCSLGDTYTPEQIKQLSSSNSQELVKTIVKKVADNEIVFNGDTSSVNLLNPPVMGSVDGNVNVNSDEYKALMTKAGSINTTAVTTSTPELINTYKTSAQYFAATDFVANVINKGLISNVAPEKRKDDSKQRFVSEFLRRQAILNMSNYSFYKAIGDRIGDSLSKNIFNGTLKRNHVTKEDANGAGYLDSLRKKVNSLNTTVSDTPVIKGMGGEQDDPEKKLLEAELLKAKMNMSQYLSWQRIEILLANKLVQQNISSKRRDLINNLKND